MKRKVREDFDLSKRYHVDVSECTIEEKKEVQQAFFDAGFQWMSGGKDHKHTYARRYYRLARRYTNTINDGTTATRYLFWSISTENYNMTAKEFLALVYEPTHTPQQVLEMAGMTTKRKVRTDFNPEGEYRVDVSMCSEEGKKEVQQAFFDAGFPWVAGGHEYQHLHATVYTNVSDNKNVTDHLMYNTDTKVCNMIAEEFLDLVYEPENQGHVHAELMAQYAEDAKTHAKPWKLWQVKSKDCTWDDCGFHPTWRRCLQYRRKPKTHIVNGVEIPDLRVTQKHGDHFYLADPVSLYFFTLLEDDEDDMVTLWIERGLVYQGTEEGIQAAILHAKAMLGIT